MRALFIILLLASGVGVANAQSPLAEANWFIDAGWMALRDGEGFERAGELSKARAAYEYASHAANRALVIGDQVGVPLDARPASPYFLYGQAELHRAQLLHGLGAPWPEIDHSLHQARQAFDDVLRLVDRRFPPGSPDWVGMRSEALFSLSTVYFLLNDLETADLVIRDLEALQPNLAPARELQGVIDYSTGQPTSFEPPPSVSPPEPAGSGIGSERFLGYAIEIGKALFGRWGTVAGMLVEDVYRVVQ